jgi:hypothetical protein
VTRSRPLLVGVGLLATALGALAVAQLVLPGLAAQRLRDQLAPDGSVQRVTVRAFPAIKLLWGRADSVTVRFSELVVTRARTGDLLARATATGKLLVSIDALTDGPLRLRAVTVRKRGDELDGRAELAGADLRAALPTGFAVQPVASTGGKLLLRAQANLLGVGFAVDALLGARNGALVIEPVGVPFASLASFTVFSDSHLSVQSVAAIPGHDGFTVTASGLLHRT